MFGFYRAVLKAACEAHEAGEISAADLRTIRRVRFRPFARAHLRELELTVAEDAVLAGRLTASALEAPSEFDWDSLLDFIRELLAMILEFIKSLLVIF